MSALSISDISITVEDGLRLSELQGRIAELQVQIGDPSTYAVSDYAIIAALLIIPFCIVGTILFCVLDDLTAGCSFGTALASVIVGEIVVVVLWIAASFFLGDIAVQYTVAGWERDVAGIQAQIDAILSKYEVVS